MSSPIGCQVCLENFMSISSLKSHLRGDAHHKQMTVVFPKDKVKRVEFLCNIHIFEMRDQGRPILGLSMVTMCFSPGLGVLVYLCHMCEETCPQEAIVGHLFSRVHCINYYNYTDPDTLRFSWLPSMNLLQILWPLAMRDMKKGTFEQLQVLDLPHDLFNSIRSLPYASAMSTLEENDKLALQLKEGTPQRLVMESYVADQGRSHALLGLQHLVECVCDVARFKRFYLCTLCQITLRGSSIINHVISFDHVYRYISAWHPSTLKSKSCYTDYRDHIETTMANYAKQAEDQTGTDNKIKRVTVTANVFDSLDASYSKALNTLETLSRVCNGRSLITSGQPRAPLELCIIKSSWRVRCQNCSSEFCSIATYFEHIKTGNHTIGRTGGFGSEYTPYFKRLNDSSKEPLIGLLFVVVCVCSETSLPALYTCFACRTCFQDTHAWKHLTSQEHAFYTTMRQNIPFAWDYEMDIRELRELALKEQANGGHVLKVFDVPYHAFSELKHEFTYLNRGWLLGRALPVPLSTGVPLRKTEPNPGYPLLGQNFVVMYRILKKNLRKFAFLCLLCGRNLGAKENAVHVISYEHVKNFLEKAHCGSLGCGDASSETLLDLAEQAGQIHPVSEIQKIHLEVPVMYPSSYLKDVQILQVVNCELIPVLAPGHKLFPKRTLQNLGQGPSEEKTQPKSVKMTTEGGSAVKNESPSTSHTSARPSVPKIEPHDPIEITIGASGRVAIKEIKTDEEGANKASPVTASTRVEKREPDTTAEVDSHPAAKIEEEPSMPDEAKPVHVENMLVSVKQEPTSPRVWSSAASAKRDMGSGGDEARAPERTESIPTQTCDKKEWKEEPEWMMRPIGSSDQEVGRLICPGEETEAFMWREKSLLKDITPTEAPKDKGPASAPALSTKLWKYIKLTKREPVIGLHTLFECHCEPHAPLYLCECCLSKIPEDRIVTHITGFEHRNLYLKLTLGDVELGMVARDAAAKHEEKTGCGEVQPIYVTPEGYHEMVHHSYVTALKIMWGCQNTLQRAPAPQVWTPKPDAPRPSEAPQPSTSVGLSHASTTTTTLASSTGTTAHVTPETKAQKTGWPENQATSAPTPKSDAVVKPSATDASSQSTVSSTLAVPTVGIPAKNPVKKCIPPPSVKPFTTSKSILRTPVTAPKSISFATNKLVHWDNTTVTAESAKDKRSRKHQPVVGLDHLVIVACEKRVHTYCLLCSVLVRHNGHLTSNGHRYEYMKLRYPDWRMQAEAKMDKKKLLNMFTYLAEIEKEKGIAPKRVEVNNEHYNRLKAAAIDHALAEVKELAQSLNQSSTTSAAEGGNLVPVSGSRGASCLADGVEPNPGAPRPPSPPASVARGAVVPSPEPPQISTVRPGRLLEQSNLSRFLGFDHQRPIIGLAFVIEVRGISQGTFCLCGACSQTFPIKLMCQHMESSEHQRTYLLKYYPQFMSWWGQDFPPEKKEGLLRDIAWMISERECYDKMDAQVILLHKDYYDYIQVAPFSQALETLQKICREEKLCRLFAVPKQTGPPARGEPRSHAHMCKESNAREKVPGVSQDTVDRELTLPIVGMCAIVECSCEEQTPYYLCVACENILSQGLVLLHIQCSRHLRQYMSERYPWCVEGVVCAGQAGDLPAEFLQRARELVEQNHDEPGTMQRIPLPLEEFSRIQTMTFDEALSRLHTISRNHSHSALLTSVTSKPRPAVKHPFEDSPADSHKAKHQRLSSPPSTDHMTQTCLKSPEDPQLVAARSNLTASKKKASGEASKPFFSQVHEPAAELRLAQPGAPSFNFAPNPSRPPVSTPRVKPAPVVESVGPAAICPQSLSESHSQTAATPPLSLSQKPDEGAAPGAHILLKADYSDLISMAAGVESCVAAAGYSKDETKRSSKPEHKKAKSKTTSLCSVPAQVSVTSATNCSAGRFAEPASSIGVIGDALNTSNPHAENTVQPRALLPQKDLGFQGYFRFEQSQTGTSQNSRLIRLLNEPVTTVGSLPIGGSTGPLAANLSAMANSSRSRSAQSNSLAHSITETSPGTACPQGDGTGEPYYVPSPYPANASVNYGTTYVPMMICNTPYNHPCYFANDSHTPVFPSRGHLASQLPTQRQYILSAWRPTPYATFSSVAPAMAASLGETAPTYQERANYSHGLPRAGTYSNNIVISNANRPQSYSNPPEGQGFQTATSFNLTSATPAVVRSEGHSEGVADFDLSTGHANGTN